MKAKVTTLLSIAALSSGTMHAALLVNWGGDYVTLNTNYSRAVTSASTACPSGTGRSKSLALSTATIVFDNTSSLNMSIQTLGGGMGMRWMAKDDSQ